MNRLKSFKQRFKFVSEDNFTHYSLELFDFQLKHNPVYREYVHAIDVDPEAVKKPEDIPFLPISIFKHRDIKTMNWKQKCVFESSGTTGIEVSKHYIQDEGFYKDVSTTIFRSFYGDPKDYVILALLPSYLERSNSSLVTMVNHLIKLSKSEHSGFYLSNLGELKERITFLKRSSQRKIILWGVIFALLDFSEACPMDLRGAIIIETGGMKGRGEEIVRKELHEILKARFKAEAVHSEYGMTELLSQAYSFKDGLFRCPPWMKVYTREINDPFCLCESGQQGVINIIDLANIHSCAFIATEDLGRVYEDGTFEVLGRLDNSDMRGCNLLLG
jgi:phenylacetate-coenzyme A ligase PaaK-like adenylate-forming protein